MIKVSSKNGVVYEGDSKRVLRRLPNDSVHCVCTSPPYYGLRDYQTGKWEGGDDGCDHLMPPLQGAASSGLSLKTDGNGRTVGKTQPNTQQYRSVCKKCGARRVDHQIGPEQTVEDYVQNLVEVFREVRRVLHPSGVLWLNLGDTYNTGPVKVGGGKHMEERRDSGKAMQTKAKPKDLLGVPWLVAFALQRDGWYWRGWLPWIRRNSMPDSATDRPATTVEIFLLFTKSSRYFFDMGAVRMAGADPDRERSDRVGGSNGYGVRHSEGGLVGSSPTRSFRSYDLFLQSIDPPHGLMAGPDGNLLALDVATRGTTDNHFAAYNANLIRPLILSGSSREGCCPTCLSPWERVERRERHATRTGDNSKVLENRKLDRSRSRDGTGNTTLGSIVGNRDPQRHCTSTRTVCWRPSCSCYKVDILDNYPSQPRQKPKESDDDYEERLKNDYQPVVERWEADLKRLKPVYDKLEKIPCTVLDPFAGTFTTGLVAIKEGRKAIGIELNREYLKLCAKRMKKGENNKGFNL